MNPRDNIPIDTTEIYDYQGNPVTHGLVTANMSEVGNLIKELRKKSKLSLKDLAEKIGMTPSFLSQVENNKTALSLSALKKIAREFNVKMSYILGEQSDDKTNSYIVVKKDDRKTLKNFGKGLKLQFLSTLNNGNMLEPTIHVLEPNIVSGIPPYQHDGQEIVLILQGSIILHLAEKEIILEAGDSCYFDSEVEHSFESNYPEGESQVLCVSSNAFFN